ncbi:MAG: aldehyde dehydrogenase family protein [Deltaproteobacteria bacterium]|nr:aldehyde dehydrogenase family protein [Deltaproteobacteria bacterium]MCB9785177.1 aldehyde dehydrogenase family protein [Deltaproteobacteria bacterium]
MIEVRAPHTGERLGEVPVRDAEAVGDAARAARTAFAAWSERGVPARVRVMGDVLGALIRHRESLLDQLVAETGKVRGDALIELTMLFDAMRYFIDRTEALLADEEVVPHLVKTKRAWISRRPRGVVGIISPWNFPLELGFGEAVPALLAGNAVLLKPSELTPLSSLEVERIAREAGLPAGVFQVLTGDGSTGAALCEVVDQLTFTGSVAVGRQVAQVAARRLIPCTLELGGKDPMIVLRDADLERAAAAAVWGAFFNSGQMCMSVERVYVEAVVHDAFVERVVARTRALRQGIDGAYERDVGAMTRQAQLEVVEAHLRDAVERGARVVVGGQRAPGLGESFYEPTVVVDVDHSMALMREETFGPVLPVMAVSSAQEAVALANDSTYGLNASVWSRDRALARRVARAVHSGSVCINDVVISYGLPELPFGGDKDSGIGRRHGPGGLRKYTVEQSVAEDRLGLRSEPHWYPYSKRTMRLVARATALFGGLERLLRR